jgi:hypothetical protein
MSMKIILDRAMKMITGMAIHPRKANPATMGLEIE